MSRRLVLALALSALSLPFVGRAQANANHQIISQSPIKRGNETIGFRAQLVLSPGSKTMAHPALGGDVRVGLGRMKYSGVPGPTPHRETLAGLRPGYILHQFKIREITGPNPTDRGPATETFNTEGFLKEVEVEVLYADNPTLKPGMKVDLVATFWKGNYWHSWGAVDGPAITTQDYVIELPR